jgi:hypothetical protein
MKANLFLVLLAFFFVPTFAQHTSPVYRSNLLRNISLNINKETLGSTLDRISEQGGFHFSYAGDFLQKDSVISLSVQNKTIREVLEQLFQGNVDFKESRNYIILRPASRRFSVVPENIYTRKKLYEIEGYVYDEQSGKTVKDASVYEKKLLRSTLTDKNGYFKLKFKKAEEGIVLTVSKNNFRDTSLQFLSVITVSPPDFKENDSDAGASNQVERSRFGRFLTSSRQRIQSLNIPDFIANSPFQASLLPGISSHGMLSSQIVNKGSLNVWGGYTAGVDGVEIGGIFNVNKKDVRKLQVAGVLNIVGGSVKGVQAGGLANVVLDSVEGVQAAGLANTVKKAISGVQAAGIVNAGLDRMDGVQAAGVANFVRKSVRGTQVAGVANINGGSLSGLQVAGVANLMRESVRGTQVAGVANIHGGSLRGSQIAGVLNYSKMMHGTQIGLINVADSSSGLGIGLLNLVRKGYHKISISSNEVLNSNISIKTGNAKLYTIIIGGMNVSTSEKVYSAGIGWGHDFIFNPRLSLAAEVSTQFLYLGKPVNNHYLYKVQTHLQFMATKGITLFAGPSYSVYYSKAIGIAEDGYKSRIAPKYSRSFSTNARGWIGWNIGLTLM